MTFQLVDMCIYVTWNWFDFKNFIQALALLTQGLSEYRYDLPIADWSSADTLESQAETGASPYKERCFRLLISLSDGGGAQQQPPNSNLIKYKMFNT